MDGLKRQRAALKGQITRIIAFIDSPPFTANEAKVRIDRLELCMQKFEHIQDQIEALADNADQISEENQYRTEFESNFYSVHAQLSDAIDEQKSEPSSDPKIDLSKALQSLAENQNSLSEIVKNLSRERDTVNISRSEVRNYLPKIILPEFSGDFDGWIRFRDLFEALVVSKDTVSGIEKLEYLQTHLKDNALSIIKHISPSNENFEVAWNLIKDHYDKPSFIKNAHLDKLFDQPVLKSGSLVEVKRLFSTSSENINALRALKQPIDSWDALLVYVLTKKLDVDNKMLWIRETKDKSEPTYSDLLDFLKQRINELECLNPSTSGRDRVQPVNNRRPFSKDHVKRVLNVTVPSCYKCNQKHFLYQCAQFRDLPVSARCNFVKLNKICENCLRAKHSVEECKFKNCKTCNSKHNTLLHVDRIPPPFACAVPSSNEPSGSNGFVTAVSMRGVPSSQDYLPMLPTAMVMIKNVNGELQPCRALLDSGSQATLISESCVQRLGLKRLHAKIPIVGLGQSESAQGTRGRVNLILSSTFDTNSCISVQAFVLTSLINVLPSFEVSSASLSFFNNLPLADPNCDRPNKIDVLLGADVFFDILAEGKVLHPSGSPIAQNTIFGWVIAGNVSIITEAPLSVNYSTVDLDVLLKRFFEPEEFSDGRRTECEVSSDAEYHFVSTHYVNPDGRFVVSLPFKQTHVEFGDSRGAALKLLYAMEGRFSKDASLKQQYVDFMRDYERLGHMAIVPFNEFNHPSYYLPHHAVLKPTSETTKLRVVFNASCKSTNGMSLNDYLRVGPTIQNDLFTCIVRFRKHRIAIKADVAKMYRQVLLNANDVHFQRIVWREEITEEPRDYMLLTVTYGTASASFLATRVLKQIGINSMHRFPRASNSIINDFYVDDYMATFESVDEAIDVKNEVINVLSEAGMDLRKWSSNSSDLLHTIPSEHRESMTELFFGETGVKTLGLFWDTKHDCFKFSSTIPVVAGQNATKREVLSDIARVFDPLGWLSPATVKMKIFMKRLWIKGVGWDEFIPNDLYKEWIDFREDLNSVQAVNIPRWLHYDQTKKLELHGFADSSEAAYAAAVYARVVGINEVQTALICAKTRIAPVKPSLSIPRLELCGSLLLSKLLSKVKEALGFHDVECFAYTDSTVVLYWIQGYPRSRNVFVDNRISQIAAQFPVSMWHHVRSAENPADCATRGVMPKHLANLDLWWNGPDFLRHQKIEFTALPYVKEAPVESEISCFAAVTETNEWDIRIFDRFSNLNRLLRVTARCILLARTLAGHRGRIRSHFLSPNDIQLAKIALFRLSQKYTMQNEISCLIRGQAVSRKSKYTSMLPFLDHDGVLRVGGRLENARIPFEQKHPVILHKDHPLTHLIVQDCHLNNLHAGLRQMTYLISLNYSIIGIHHIIKRCIYQCTTCIRQRAIPYQQQMASLPKQRLEPGVTFGNTGVDYAGPFLIRTWKGRGAKQHKVYISLFICMATKALHLELVSDLSSSAFIAALRRFVSRRGKCHSIYSDNGTNFVGANQQLRDWANLLNSAKFQEDVSNELTSNGINWHFSPPHAPHFGGLWEAAVKTTKYHLRRAIGQTSLTYEEFSTVLCQIEACANSRPLCMRFEGDVDPLTPAHFLIARPLKTVPDPSILTGESLRDRWQYIQRLVLGFWQKWSQDYLSQLQKRPKWLEKLKNIKPDDVVVLIHENQPPCRWLMGKITKTYPGKDGLTRVASVTTAKGEFKRPISKLCPLLVDSS